MSLLVSKSGIPFQVCLSVIVLIHSVRSTSTDLSELEEPLDDPLLIRFKGIADEIADHAKELSLDEARQLSNHALDIIAAIKTHHPVGIDAVSHRTADARALLRGAVRVAAHDDPPGPQPSECGVSPDPYPANSNVPLGHREKIMKEENVTLAYFDPGYTGRVSSGDPRVFGPDAWRTLHRFSINYPQEPNVQAQAACQSFIQGLPYMIPCPHCGYHFLEFTVLNGQFSGQTRDECLGTCTSPAVACSNQSALVSLFVRAHNNVNIHNYKARPNWTSTDVYTVYGSGSMIGPPHPYGPGPQPWTTQGPIDGKCQLIKCADQERETGYPDFLKHGSGKEVLRNVHECTQDD